MLLRFDPFRELDRFAEQRTTPRPAVMPMDAVRRGDLVEVSFDLPGIDPESLDVTVERNVLVVSAERTPDRREGEEVIVAERRHGRMSRQLFLGESLDAGRLEARYEHGVLTLTVPVAEAAQPRRVEVAVGGGQPTAIETNGRAAG